MKLFSSSHRKFWTFENPALRIRVSQGGGHIAALELKQLRRPNPLWTPPWKSIEPWSYDAKRDKRAYGDGPESRLLAGLLGHNLALDTFGGPSPAEVRAGCQTHGEVGVTKWKRQGSNGFSARLPLAQLDVLREIVFHDTLPIAMVRTRVRNLGRYDRPIAWAEHVTFGPPFLAPQTEFAVPASRAIVYPTDFGKDSRLVAGQEFVWPDAPLRKGKSGTPSADAPEGGTHDMQFPPRTARATDFTAQLFDTPFAWFTATNSRLNLAVGYLFHRHDFPWIGIWDEKMSRVEPPWNRRTFARGMEFSTTPFPMSRRAVITQGQLFGTPTYRWIEALSEIETEFVIYIGAASEDGAGGLQEHAERFLQEGAETRAMRQR